MSPLCAAARGSLNASEGNMVGSFPRRGGVASTVLGEEVDQKQRG